MMQVPDDNRYNHDGVNYTLHNNQEVVCGCLPTQRRLVGWGGFLPNGSLFATSSERERVPSQPAA